MPTPPPDRSRRSLSHWQQMFLLYGPADRWNDAFADQREVREAGTNTALASSATTAARGRGRGGRTRPRVQVSDIQAIKPRGRFCSRPGCLRRRNVPSLSPGGVSSTARMGTPFLSLRRPRSHLFRLARAKTAFCVGGYSTLVVARVDLRASPPPPNNSPARRDGHRTPGARGLTDATRARCVETQRAWSATH